PGDDQPLERMGVGAESAGRAGIAVSAAHQRFGEYAAVWVHFDIAGVEDDPGAPHRIVERQVIWPDDAGDAIALEHAFARQLAEIGMLERAADEHAQRPDDSALHRQPRAVGPATHAVEVRVPRPGGAVAIVGRAVALAEIAEAVRAGQAQRESQGPAVP